MDFRRGFTYQYADVEGYHLYIALNIGLEVTTGEDSDVSSYLYFLEALTKFSERLSAEYGAQVLEVQNDKLHILFEGDADDRENDLIEFCSLVHQAATVDFQKFIGHSLRSLKYAATHGRAIIVSTGRESSDSMVSLGPAANDPAKKLASGDVAPGHLMYRKSPKHDQWASVNISASRSKHGVGQKVASETLMALTESDSIVVNRELSIPSSTVDAPTIIQGFMMRCDLDGFTKQVQEAFDSGSEEVVNRLVQRFTEIMGYEEVYRQSAGRHQFNVIKLPWAGDCANMVLIPEDNYTLARKSVPVKAAGEWLGQKSDKIRGSANRWATLMNEADWLVSLAGGGEQEDESNGTLLIADVPGGFRNFRIVAGWGSRRSLDAQGAKVVRANDTVLPQSDKQALDAPLAELFSPCAVTSTYHRSANLNRNSLSQAISRVKIEVPYISRLETPKPRSYYEDLG